MSAHAAAARCHGPPRAYRGKLLALPGFLGGVADPAADLADDLAAGLALTGYFINGHVFGLHGQHRRRANVLSNVSRVSTGRLLKECRHDRHR